MPDAVITVGFDNYGYDHARNIYSQVPGCRYKKLQDILAKKSDATMRHIIGVFDPKERATKLREIYEQALSE